MNSEDNTYIASERGDELAIAIAIEKLAKPEARLQTVDLADSSLGSALK